MQKLILILVLISSCMNAQTRLIAHRGFWKTNPTTTENSLASLKNAQALKIYGTEFDVRMSKDGVLVVNHDEHHGKMEVSETNYKDLADLKLSNDENFPTLKKFLKKGKKDPNLKLIIELKPAKTKALENEIVEKTLAMVEKYGLENQSEYISFSINICEELKKHQPNAIVQYLNGDLSPQELKEKGIDGLDYHYKVLTEKHPTWISEAKALGLITNAWTVNSIEIYQQLQKMGIDFVTTNIPDELQKL